MSKIDIASRVERRLNEQLSEFNILRDRIMAVIGFSIGLMTFVFSYIDQINSPFFYLVIALTLISLISIAILIAGLLSEPLSRGMNSDLMKSVIETNTDKDAFFNHDISYNLESFQENAPKLEKVRNKLNYGLLVQAIVSVLLGLCIYLNNCTNDKEKKHDQICKTSEKDCLDTTKSR